MDNSVLPGLRCASLALCVLAAPAVQAELSNDTMLGLGLRTRPAYDGSSAQRTELVPVLRHFGPIGFVRSTQGVLEGGARLELAPGLHAGAQLAYEPGRRRGDADFLDRHGVASIGRGASIGVHAEWDAAAGPVPITLLARLRRHTDSELGLQADLRLSAGVLRSGPLGAGVFVQATWADTRSTGAFYGITPAQSAATGLPVFGAGGGWLSASAGLLWSVALGADWVAVGNLEARQLRGDAARSPLAERRWNHAASAGLARRF